MTAKELFSTYPKAAEVIKKYYTDAFINSLTAIDDDEKKEFASSLLNDEYIESFIDNNPRGCFDPLDDNKVYVEVTVMMGEPVFFIYHVNGEVNNMPPYMTRLEAEKAAIEKGFQILNDKL